jgi:hypothetical protein
LFDPLDLYVGKNTSDALTVCVLDKLLVLASMSTAMGNVVQVVSINARQPSTSLSLAFEISVPSYYLKAQQIQAISVLNFLSGILAIGGGVIAAGTLLAFIYSYSSHHFFGDSSDAGGYELSQRKTMSSFG